MTTEAPNPTAHLHPHTVRGLNYARWSGHFLSLLLIVMGLVGFTASSLTTFELFKSAYFLIYGIVLSLPFAKMSDQNWKRCYILLVALSALFVFVMVAVVMFAYMAADARGERLGVPGFEGTLIFLALLQVPVVLFQRKPDLLD